ncbi:MAG TPA: hypothetical protein VJT85_07900, partial [Gemmatimonadaceae bacterium]|nr:hypothetical protein [Gemmatimonadaceae bacterium]
MNHHDIEPPHYRTTNPERRMCRLVTSNILVRAWTLGASLLLIPGYLSAQVSAKTPDDSAASSERAGA